MIAKGNYIFLSGVWQEQTAIGNFLSDIIPNPVKDNLPIFQLKQTFAECELETYENDFVPDIRKLEQYRAFCEDWELWIRTVNCEEMRLRFIGREECVCNEGLRKLQEKGVEYHNLDVFSIESAKYPLWGEPLEMEDVSGKKLSGWYTSQIPKIIEYPVSLEAKSRKIYLFTENFLRENGSVDIVRYKRLGDK